MGQESGRSVYAGAAFFMVPVYHPYSAAGLYPDELKRRMDHWQEMAKELNSKVDLH